MKFALEYRLKVTCDVPSVFHIVFTRQSLVAFSK